jgi:hypothetical protein
MKTFSLEDFEAEVAKKFLARANPPPILHRYRRQNEWTLAEISICQVYASKPEDLNDPFECSAPVLWNVDLMKQHWLEAAPMRGLSVEEALREFNSSWKWGVQRMAEGLRQKTAQTGIVCFAARPDSIRMWAYYAESHKGICIGYDTKHRPFNIALKVNYQNPDKPFDVFACLKDDPTEIASHIALRKAEEWKFEDEYRIPVNIERSPRHIPFEASAIKEVRFGARIEPGFRGKVLRAISVLPIRPKLIQMGCDFERFVLTETFI